MTEASQINPEHVYFSDGILSALAEKLYGHVLTKPINLLSFKQGVDFDFSKPPSQDDIHRMHAELSQRKCAVSLEDVESIFHELNNPDGQRIGTSIRPASGGDEFLIITKRSSETESLQDRVTSLLGMDPGLENIKKYEVSSLSLDNLLAFHKLARALEGFHSEIPFATPQEEDDETTYEQAQAHWNHFNDVNSFFIALGGSEKTVQLLRDMLLLASIANNQPDLRALGYWNHRMAPQEHDQTLVGVIDDIHGTVRTYAARAHGRSLHSLHMKTESVSGLTAFDLVKGMGDAIEFYRGFDFSDNYLTGADMHLFGAGHINPSEAKHKPPRNQIEERSHMVFLLVRQAAEAAQRVFPETSKRAGLSRTLKAQKLPPTAKKLH